MSDFDELPPDEPFEQLPPVAAETAIVLRNPAKESRALPPLDLENPEVALVAAVCGDPDGGIWGRVGIIPTAAFTTAETRSIWAAWKDGVKLDDGAGLIAATGMSLRRYAEWAGADRMGSFASMNARAVTHAYHERRKAEITAEAARQPDIPASELARRFAEIAEENIVGLPVARPASSFSYPTGDDPSVLLGSDDYLCRGGGMLFISHAGAGKSSWIYDAIMSWGLSRPWMGIRCHGQLKTLVIQAEDSDRYIGKVVGSYKHIHKLTPADQTALDAHFVIAEVRGAFGAEFMSVLRSLVGMHKPDLVVINPIYLYADGDISKGEVVQRFLAGLDAINAEKKFGYILIHHTGKPAKKEGAKGEKAQVEDWESAYMGIGSSFWANWPRCSALLEPVSGVAGKYTLRLGKGGMNAGVTKEVDQGAGKRLEPTTRVQMKHSKQTITINGQEKPCIYWEADDEPAEEESDTESRPTPPGLKFSDFRQLFVEHCPSADKAKQILVLARLCKSVRYFAPAKFQAMLDEAKRDGVMVQTNRGYYLA